MERSKQKTVGVIHSVPCPWCRHPNDLRDLKEQMLVEAGARIICDGCQKIAEIHAIDTRPRVVLKQYHPR